MAFNIELSDCEAMALYYYFEETDDFNYWERPPLVPVQSQLKSWMRLGGGLCDCEPNSRQAARLHGRPFIVDSSTGTELARRIDVD